MRQAYQHFIEKRATTMFRLFLQSPHTQLPRMVDEKNFTNLTTPQNMGRLLLLMTNFNVDDYIPCVHQFSE